MHGFDSFSITFCLGRHSSTKAVDGYGFWVRLARGGFGILTIMLIGYRKINCHTQRVVGALVITNFTVKHSPTDPGTTYRRLSAPATRPEIPGQAIYPRDYQMTQ